MYRSFGKRLFDLGVTLVVLPFLLPVMLLIALLVRLFLGPQVLFRQQRPGLHGKPFTMLKFRTMTDARDADGRLLPDAQRLPAFGRWLRSTSLDELPELWCVLRGEMSLVGPRPLLMRYLERYSLEQMRRHDLLPGITGWAQIHGRNAVSWDEKFTLDLWYVRHYSFWIDVQIILRTFEKVWRRDGVSQEGMATVDEFRGTSQSAG